MRGMRLFGAVLAGLLLASIGTEAAWAIPVNREIVLLVDVSGSVDATEFDLMRSGWADAFRDPSVRAAITSAPGGIAVTMVFWSGAFVGMGPAEGFQETKIDWMQLQTDAQILTFADAIDAIDTTIFGNMDTDGGAGLTALADAVLHGTDLLTMDNGFEGDFLIMDVSGDGFENVDFDPAGCDSTNFPGCVDQGFVLLGPPPAAGDVYTNPTLFFGDVIAARDAAVAAGMIINGLAVITDHGELGSFFYDPFVRGGSGSQVFEAATFTDFATAARDKLLFEVQLPEPSALLLIGSVLAGLAIRGRGCGTPTRTATRRAQPPMRYISTRLRGVPGEIWLKRSSE